MEEGDRTALEQRVAALRWYHSVDLGGGLVTPGEYDHRPYLPFYGLPADLSGRRALDIGAASGFFAFELERRGAQVLAVDLPAWIAHDFGPLYQGTEGKGDRYLDEPFELARSVLGSHVERRRLNVYDLSPGTVGTFDFVFCGSVLQHLTDPVRALWRIQEVTRGVAIIATGIHWQADGEPMAAFRGHDAGDTWWLPNQAGLERMVESAGFAGHEWFSKFRLDFRDGRPGTWHGVVRAWNGRVDLNLPPPPQGKAVAGPRPAGAESEPLGVEWDRLRAENARLRALIAGYERGRFVRLMAWLARRWRSR